MHVFNQQVIMHTLLIVSRTTTITTTTKQPREASVSNRRRTSTPLWGVVACSHPRRRPNQSQPSGPMSFGHHISTGHRPQKKQLTLILLLENKKRNIFLEKGKERRTRSKKKERKRKRRKKKEGKEKEKRPQRCTPRDGPKN